MQIDPVKEHRSREGGAIIYPVYSRRSGGLSVGVNLFPGRKVCSFDCPYCEVFPFESEIHFKLEVMKSALRSCLVEAVENAAEVRDVCFSGSGEPTLSPYFPQALEAARALRGELAPDAKLVLITNGTGLLGEKTFALLEREAKRGLVIWLKLDAGTEAWFRAVDRPRGVSFGALLERIKAFAKTGVPFTLQTMICRINGAPPPPADETAWLSVVTELAETSRRTTGGSRETTNGLRAVQVYGKARPAPDDPLAQAAPPETLEQRAALLRTALEAAGVSLPVDVYL